MQPEYELNLIRKSQRGDAQAFRELVESHQGLAYSIAFRFTREEQESEDIVQEAFIKIWQNLSKYNEEFRFKTWLARIVTNQSLDYLKSARKKSSSQSLMKEEMSVTQNEQKIELEELKSIVYQLADQLTEKQRAVFILRDLEMMQPEEVCSILQMPDGNMKSNLYYARLKIKEGLKKFYKD
jgi:RNA polymerase sigma-70 factor (ECF subfamily)